MTKRYPDDIHDGGVSNVKRIDDNLYISIKPCGFKERFLRFSGVTWIRSLRDENHNCYLKDTPYETSYKHDDDTKRKLGYIINELDYSTTSTFNLDEINL